MNSKYWMTEKTCFLCSDNNGLEEDGTPNKPAFKKCDHIVGVGILDLKINETELLLKQLKKAKRYAKVIGIQE